MDLIYQFTPRSISVVHAQCFSHAHRDSRQTNNEPRVRRKFCARCSRVRRHSGPTTQPKTEQPQHYVGGIRGRRPQWSSRHNTYIGKNTLLGIRCRSQVGSCSPYLFISLYLWVVIEAPRMVSPHQKTGYRNLRPLRRPACLLRPRRSSRKSTVSTERA